MSIKTRAAIGAVLTAASLASIVATAPPASADNMRIGRVMAGTAVR